jgi:integrase
VDKNPEWRDTAVFTREEIGALLRADIEWQYRTMYATWLLTGSRFSELLPVTVEDYDRARRPLGSLKIPSAKSRRDKGQLWRLVPVHPELRVWLDWWIAEGYAVTHGNPPSSKSLLFPTLSPRRREAGEALCSHGEVYKRWARHHVKAAGIRHRRLHDARRTFLSIARSSGASAEIARAVTHKATADRVLDGYTTWEWEALCRELGKVEWRIPGPPGATAAVIDLDARRQR